MVAMGFLSPRSESLVLCDRTDATNAIPVAFGERSGPFDAGASRLRKLRARGRVQRTVAITVCDFEPNKKPPRYRRRSAIPHRRWHQISGANRARGTYFSVISCMSFVPTFTRILRRFTAY